MPTFQSSPQYEHGLPESLGVLIVNLGTPDAPTPAAVRRYLGQFLSDPRVVELPRPLWWIILHGFILRVRPSRSAEAYQKIWTEDGSPLLLHSQDIASAIGQQLSARFSGSVNVELGMCYGSPSIETALSRLYEQGARRIVCLPLYPQYSGTTSGSVFDLVTAALSRRRWVPEFRFINHYHDARGYIAAQAQNIREYWDEHGRGNKLLFSFHGLPQDNLLKGDPYHCQCQKTARLVAESLELADDEWLISFQSRVGRAEWLRPYTDETVIELGSKGTQQLDVVCPGFAADCLETLEEIAMQNAKFFVDSGGGSLNYIAALNARDDHIAFLTRLIEKHVGGWPESSTDWSASEAAREQDKSRERALAMGASL
ncbi:MAG: ferrochelatase [Gammaproteobacteria bacterium]|jgi:ferrochelatase|nr:ferrochelatase [Gammaproteobacteria bacterium]MDH3749894.1 ferrochelatase [Gammaproteobacteria bacterium]MDH3803950.1 ferrochelatase [Gammaproteobacteria bacterium]